MSSIAYGQDQLAQQYLEEENTWYPVRRCGYIMGDGNHNEETSLMSDEYFGYGAIRGVADDIEGIRVDGFVALLTSENDARSMDKMGDSSSDADNTSNLDDADHIGHVATGGEYQRLRGDEFVEVLLSEDESLGLDVSDGSGDDNYIGHGDYDDASDDSDDNNLSRGEWALPRESEKHIIEAAEKILRQTPKNSIDVWVLYQRLQRYRRLRLLSRAVACALAMQMREEEKLILQRIIPEVRFNINALSEKVCIDRFRFRKVQLAYLHTTFQLPAFFSTQEKYRVSGIEALCITLERLGYPARWRKQEKTFGRSDSDLSSIFYFECEHIAERCIPLLKGDWDRVSARLEDFASAIRAKGSALPNLWGFIDSTVRKICRPGDSTEQRAMYNGHKRSHAVKYQAVTTPGRMIVQFFGPAEGRAHDLTLLEDSDLETIISRDRRSRGYLLYGDPAYGQTNVFASPFDEVGATREELAVNKSLSRVRISVEWGFGEIVNEWAMLDFKRKMTLGNVPVGLLYEVVAIFANCVTIARHQNVLSSYLMSCHPHFKSILLGWTNLITFSTQSSDKTN